MSEDKRGPLVFALPESLDGLQGDFNECLEYGRQLAARIGEGTEKRSELPHEQRVILGLTALLYAFSDKIEEQTQTLQLAAKDHADALGRLCRARLLLDELRKRSAGYAEMKQHQQGAIMMGVVDAVERVLGTTEKPLAAYVDAFMKYQREWGEPS